MDSSPETIASHSTPAQVSKPSLPQPEKLGGATTQPWRHLEGQVIGGKFRLIQYLGGSDHSAVFLTERPEGEPGKAAIKLVAARPEKNARRLSRWAEAEKMSHPHLLRLFEMGQCQMGGENLLYLVMEYAEENLSQVVQTRPLSARECQQMLPPVLDALAYLHRQGFAHGHLKPANILAAQERVKLSCDGLAIPREGSGDLGTPSVYDPPETANQGLSPAGDVWSLGMMLVEVVTRKVPVLEAGRREPVLPPTLPTALLQIVRHCLRLDPQQRWTIGEINARLASAPAVPRHQAEYDQQPAGSRKRYLPAAIVVAIVAIIAVAGWVFTRPRRAAAPAQTAAPAPAQAASAASKAVPVTPLPAPPAASSTTPVEPPPASAADSAPGQTVQHAVVREVVPRVPQSARDTIHGTVRVRVRVALDAKGSVASATFESAGPSRYFARLAMQAAQEWKFAPPQPQGPNTAEAWRLRFEFRRNSTHVIPTPLNR